MNKRYIVRLEADERERLTNLVKTGKSAAYRIKHANILLMVDANADACRDNSRHSNDPAILSPISVLKTVAFEV